MHANYEIEYLANGEDNSCGREDEERSSFAEDAENDIGLHDVVDDETDEGEEEV